MTPHSQFFLYNKLRPPYDLQYDIGLYIQGNSLFELGLISNIDNNMKGKTY